MIPIKNSTTTNAWQVYPLFLTGNTVAVSMSRSYPEEE